MASFFQTPPSPQTIAVIVGFDLIGDGLIKLPFLRALRAAYPQARISWIAAQGTSVYARQLKGAVGGLIDEVLEQPAWLPSLERPDADVKEAPSYDVLIDTRNRWQEALRARRLKPKLFIGPAWRYLFSDQRPWVFKPKPRHVLGRLFEMLELVHGTVPEVKGGLPLDTVWIEKARRLLPEGSRSIGFAPGAGADHKIWPLDNFIALAKRMTALGYRPVFILGPKEIDWQQTIQQKLPEALFPLQQDQIWSARIPAIEATIAIGHCLTAAVANDSGTGHMLAAADCPLLSLFGPTDAGKLAPRSKAGRSLSAASMAEIKDEDVYAALTDMLMSIKS